MIHTLIIADRRYFPEDLVKLRYELIDAAEDDVEEVPDWFGNDQEA